MACGYYHTLILSATGNDVLACGLNRNGQLGIGSLGTQTKKISWKKNYSLYWYKSTNTDAAGCIRIKGTLNIALIECVMCSGDVPA